jgi:exopolysaccharide biosynthesis WecB/TagA/CpsF family protein
MMPSQTGAKRRLSVDGVPVNVPTLHRAVDDILDAAERRQGFAVFTLNLSHVVHMRSHPDFHRAYRRARFVTADGFPIAMLARLVGARVRRTTGADLLVPVCAEAGRRSIPVFLFGSDATTLAESSRRLTGIFKGLQIVGTAAPDMPFDPYSPAADAAIATIRASGARLCVLALGTPRQEVFAARCLDALPGVGMLCFGASLDFLAGTQQRAPRFAQNSGLEWAWRILKEPRRLGPRYARCAAVIPRLLAETFPQILDAQLGFRRWHH